MMHVRVHDTKTHPYAIPLYTVKVFLSLLRKKAASKAHEGAYSVCMFACLRMYVCLLPPGDAGTYV